jgi:ATP-dependent DNA helicase RecG
MTQEKIRKILEQLVKLPVETEWVEFKESNFEPQAIGEYISALSNSACCHQKEKAYLVFGIENETHNIVGTRFKPKKKKVGNEELENWLITQLNPRIDFVIHEFQEEGKPIVLFEIDAAGNAPVKFRGDAFIRVGSYKKKLSAHPEKERKIWMKQPDFDWSAQVCEDATIGHLDPQALLRARQEYKHKYPHLSEDVDNWDDTTFLNKAKVTIEGQITRAALILLGKDEAYHFLSPAVPQITWILKDEHNTEKDYTHFGLPFILSIEKVFKKIRNLNYRYLPDGTLFPIEITQYDPWVIREALHNCIAHQDYQLKGRINVVEKPDESVIEKDAPPEMYRNLLLANAMVHLNMIDTIGSGIKKMFTAQRKRFFALPSYDLSEKNRTGVKIFGKILDENYTRLLMNKPDLPLKTIILLDKVQKNIMINESEYQHLDTLKLIDGTYPNIYVVSYNAELYRQNGGTPLNVFISSTGVDLYEYRKMAVEVINRYKVVVPLGAEFVNGEAQDAKTVDGKSITNCDVFVGIYAHRYGYIPEGQDKSITEMEFELAGKSGKEVILFIVDPDFPWPPKFIEMEKHQQLKDFLSRVKKEAKVSFFKTPADFKNTFSTALGLILQKTQS